MDIKAVKLVCFSPTGTSWALLKAVAQGLDQGAEWVDITRPEVRAEPLGAAADELLVIAVPVYGGRVPLLAARWLERLQADNTPMACVVVYGNRAFEDALLELTDLVRAGGGVPVAGAAFVAEHSFSSDERPIAVGRPDAADLERAEDFGRRLGERVATLVEADQVPALAVPGDRPYKERKAREPVEFIAVSDDCVQCGLCAQVCPVEAIDSEDSRVTDLVKCIRCCACIKVCPQQARSLMPSWIMDAATWLTTNCADRKEPEFFF